MRDRRRSRVHRGVAAMASLAVAAAGVALPAVVAPATAMGPVAGACEWTPDVLPLPDGMFHARVTAGAGEWLAGIAGADGVNEAVRWRDGEVEALGAAFGLHTAVTGVNADGVVVGTVT